MKIVVVYSSRCSRCLPYIEQIENHAKSLEIDFERYDIELDIFNSIHHIVNVRIELDPTINSLPCLIVYTNSKPKYVFCGECDINQIFSQLKLSRV